MKTLFNILIVLGLFFQCAQTNAHHPRYPVYGYYPYINPYRPYYRQGYYRPYAYRQPYYYWYGYSYYNSKPKNPAVEKRRQQVLTKQRDKIENERELLKSKALASKSSLLAANYILFKKRPGSSDAEYKINAFTKVGDRYKVRFESGNEAYFNESEVHDIKTISAFDYRVWTDHSGRHTTIAKMVSKKGNEVLLLKSDGSSTVVEISKLSFEDVKFLNAVR